MAHAARWGWHAAFVAQLGVALLPALSHDPPVVFLVASGALVAWCIVAWPRRTPRDAARAAWRPALILWSTAIGAIALSYFDGYVLAPATFLIGPLFAWLPVRRAIGSVIVLGSLVGARLTVDLGWQALLIGAGTAGVAIGLALFIERISTQSELRRVAIAQLDAGRADIVALERQRGALGERQRIAREVHDTVVQDLISVLRLVESARQTLARSSAAADHYLVLGEHAARDGLAEARRLVHASHPPTDLAQALQRCCARFAAESGITPRVDLAALDELPTEVAVALLRVAQEALANIGKHAKASSVAITLTRIDTWVVLDVDDDGVGLCPAAIGGAGARGFGLAGLRQRIEELGGVFTVDSVPGEGTVVTAQLSIAARRTP